MTRVLVFLVAVAVAALGAAWLADRPGDVSITWLGYHADTYVSVLIAVVALGAVALSFLWWLFRALLRSPASLGRFLRRRRHERGFAAISRGLIAIGAGDLSAARRYSGEAGRYTPDEPLALLLAAQTAQLAGNRAAAEGTFRRMADRHDTRLLGLHGLFIEARRRSDAPAARELAEAAVKANPTAGWAAQAVLEFRCLRQDWAGALAALDSNLHGGLIDKPAWQRSRAVLLTARALTGGDRDAALADVSEAARLAPGLVPAAALAGRLIAEAGRMRRASRVIEAAWRINPHPDLAETYANVRPGDSARDRLTRVQALARITPDEPEGRLAVARAAIDAREFPVARAALDALIAAPTRRVALLMAELEQHDTGDIGRARQWMARALHAAPDPAWTADGLVSEKWLPVSPATGRLDAFQWKVPLSDLDAPTRVIELDTPIAGDAASPPAASTPAPLPAALPREESADDLPAADGLVSRAPPREPESDHATLPAAPSRRSEPPRPAQALPSAPVPRADDIIPLVHSPDDPGPDADLADEPSPVPPTPDPWWRRLSR